MQCDVVLLPGSLFIVFEWLLLSMLRSKGRQSKEGQSKGASVKVGVSQSRRQSKQAPVKGGVSQIWRQSKLHQSKGR